MGRERWVDRDREMRYIFVYSVFNLLTVVVRLTAEMIEQRCLRPKQLAAMIAGNMFFVRVRADVLDEAILVLQLLVAQRPVALGLGPLVVWRLLYLIFEGGVLHNVILELDYGNERALAVTPAAVEILFQLGQLVAVAWQCIAGRYLGMELALVLAL